MPTLAQVRTAADNKLTTLWPNVQAREAAYFAAHGHYWQGIVTTDVDALPDNLATGTVLEMVPDLTRKPSDQPTSWAGEGLALGSLPMALQIDVYEAPEGHGYVATVYVRYRGTTYYRSASVGPVALSAPWAIYAQPTGAP
jgi:hypothetical protein